MQARLPEQPLLVAQLEVHTVIISRPAPAAPDVT
jgi:hypothetical protein